MKNNVVKEKSFELAVRVVKLYKFLISSKKEYVLSKQLLRSGTSVGAMIREAVCGESKADFIHKLGIAQKECNESLYWLELLFKTDYLNEEQFQSIYADTEEVMRLITSIIVKSKNNV